jgi:hypothetical protein
MLLLILILLDYRIITIVTGFSDHVIGKHIFYHIQTIKIKSYTVTRIVDNYLKFNEKMLKELLFYHASYYTD